MGWREGKRRSFLTQRLSPLPRAGAWAPLKSSSVNSPSSHRRPRRVWDDVSNVPRMRTGEKTMKAKGNGSRLTTGKGLPNQTEDGNREKVSHWSRIGATLKAQHRR